MRRAMPPRANGAGLRHRDRAFLWPFLEVRRVVEAVGRSWKRILVGAALGWLVAVVGGAVLLVALERLGAISLATSDTLGVVIVFCGIALGAMLAYALRPAAAGERGAPMPAPRRYAPARARPRIIARPAPTRRPPASTRPPRARGSPRPRGIGEETRRHRRSRAANR